ncbi:(Fe-S)-binding protein [Corynebacterium vitaeruminis]|uniref:(Fe-S)-binding protein n=1 Tax=Corynebacterium vitaeruminis TaxID=38305 RepID=UPI001E59D768|nr:(Fe-S)-binding protein [Corynebacterium vitaeruminis]
MNQPVISHVLASPATTPVTTTLGIAGIVLSLPAWIYFILAVARLYRFVAAGKPSYERTNQPLQRLGTMLKEVFFHTELVRKPAVAVAHWFVMLGFLIGSLVWFEAYIQTFAPDSGWPIIGHWAIYHLAEEVLALGTVIGIAFLFALRISKGTRERLSRFYGSNSAAAFFVEAVVFVEGLGMLLVKASKIATYGHASWTDFVTREVAALLPASATLVSAFALVKLLTGMIWLVVVARNLNWGVAWHRFLAFFNIFFRRNPGGAKALGAAAPMLSDGQPLTLETLDEAGDEPTLGVGKLGDAPWKMLLDAATCTECGRCQEQCPAWHTEKPLSPKLFVTDIRDAAVANSAYLTDPATFAADESHAGVDVLKLVGESQVIKPDVLWSCTNCGACVEQCPVDIEHIDHVLNLRRFQVLAESDFPSELTGLFKNLETKGNPWGRNNSERQSWIDEARRDGLEVPVFGEDVHDFDDLEYLFWVGCAGAFDDEGKKTTRAVVELLHTAGVKFAVLSKGETCTGDPARRAGNEFLFQQLALDNVATLNGVFEGVPQGQRKIITTCAHCFNTLRNEYPDFDGHFDVFHHTQLLSRLVRDKLLTPIPRTADNRQPITYHDPCFLGRHNKVFDPPRELLGLTGANLIEMDRNRNEGFCCGAGGARMFMEEKLGTRINENRAAEAVATGAEVIAVGCPYCNTMLTTGVKTVAEKQAAPVVKDVARLLRDSVLVDGTLPEPRAKAFLESPRRTPRREDKQQPKVVATPPTTPGAPVSATHTPATPAAGVPAPGVPAPTAGVPQPGTVPTPAAIPSVPVPGAAVPPPTAVPTLQAAAPTPTVPTPASPSVPSPAVPTPTPAVPTPGAAVPKPTIPAPGSAAPAPAVPSPGAVPPPSVPTPAAAAPKPTIPAPGAIPPPAAPMPNVPVPGASAPAPAVPAPTPSVPAPGAAIPRPAVPSPSPTAGEDEAED